MSKKITRIIKEETVGHRIQQMSSLSEFESIKQEILVQKPGMFSHYFLSLLRKAKAIASEETLKHKFELLEIVFNTRRAAPITKAEKGKNILLPNVINLNMPVDYWEDISDSGHLALWIIVNDGNEHCLVKVKAAMALWESRSFVKENKEFPVAINDVIIKAIEQCCYCFEYYLEIEDPLSCGMVTSDYWELAIFLSTLTNKIELLAPYLPLAQSLTKELDIPAPHWTARFYELEAHLIAYCFNKNIERETLIERAKELKEDAKATLQSLEYSQLHSHGMAIQEVVDRLESLSGSSVDTKEVYKRKAAVALRLASLQPTSWVKANHFKTAAHFFQIAQEQEEATKCLNLSRDFNAKSKTDGSLKKISVSMKMTYDQMDSMLTPFFEGVNEPWEFLFRISSILFAPTIDNGLKETQGASIADLFKTIRVIDDRSLAEVTPSEDAGFRENRQIITEINWYNEILLPKLFQKAIGTMDLAPHDVFNNAIISEFIDNGDIYLLEKGVERFFSSDWISTLHILVPRIEQVVRRILRKLGANTTTLRDDTQQEKPFGELLREAENKNLIPRKIIVLMRATLTEEWGLNLRNRIAHGLLSDGEATEGNACRAVHLLLIVCSLQLVSN